MITITDVTKKYNDTIILEHASYTFPQIGLVCLLGASGSGKTTLLNLLAGFDTRYEGDIKVGGTSLHSMDADALCRYRRDNIGFVFQNYHLLKGYTVLENILLACEISDADLIQKTQRAKELLKKLSISEKENEKIENLSGGQKQRVAIARALINDPQIIFADEPTGALDRTTSSEIMTLLKTLSEERLVVVITHDQKICDFADEVIHIKDRNIIVEQSDREHFTIEKLLMIGNTTKGSMIHRAIKNFKIHLKRYVAVSLAISIGMLAFLFSLSFGNVMEQSIDDFKAKNTAFNNGYIKGADDGTILDFLTSNERITNAYYQYKLNDIALTAGEVSETILEKFPMPKSTEGLSYGVMPRTGEQEIALTPSLAKKLSSDIKSLLGQRITLQIGEKKYDLTVSGIYNAGYDDFFVSSDVEQQMYSGMNGQDNYSISYDVKDFDDVVAVSNQLKLRGLSSENAAKEVYALQNTFASLSKLFLIVSALILGIALFICIVLLVKLQSTRYREIGLLSALGFSRNNIATIILQENLLLSGIASILNLIMLLIVNVFGKLSSLPFIVTGVQVALCVIATFAVVMLISCGTSSKLIRTEPAEALR